MLGWLNVGVTHDVKYTLLRYVGATFRMASNIYAAEITKLLRKRSTVAVYVAVGKSERDPETSGMENKKKVGINMVEGKELGESIVHNSREKIYFLGKFLPYKRKKS